MSSHKNLTDRPDLMSIDINAGTGKGLSLPNQPWKLYQWAWSAVGEHADIDELFTVQSGSDCIPSYHSNPKKGIQIKFSPGGTTEDDDIFGSFIDFNDSVANNASGQLNARDTERARYLHLFINTENSAGLTAKIRENANTTASTQGPGGEPPQMCWFSTDDTSSYQCFTKWHTLHDFGKSRFVIIYDMARTNSDGTVDRQGGEQGLNFGDPGPGSWGDIAEGEREAPIYLEYWIQALPKNVGSTGVGSLSVGETGFSFYGYLLADRPLKKSELFLPIPIAKAKS